MTWHDRKPISFLGTVPTCKDDSGVVERSMKVNGHWVKQNFASYGIVSLYNAYMDGVDVSDQRISSYARLMRGAAQYYKIFILSHRSMYFKCAHFGKKISKSYHHNHFSLQKVIDKWLDWRKSFRRDTQMQQPSTSDIWFNQEHFHHLDKSSDKRSTCKVHLEHVDTFYSCAVCGVHMCLEPCFLRYHTLKDYYFIDEDSEGPWHLKEGRGRVAPEEEEEFFKIEHVKKKHEGGSKVTKAKWYTRQWEWLTLRLSQR